MRGSGKIVIKPRNVRKQPTPEPEPEPSEDASAPEDSDQPDEEAAAGSDAEEEQTSQKEDMDVDEEGGDDEGEAPAEGSAEPVKRGRGRPRGSGRGRISVPTGRPRGRPRGSGRGGRGRGRGRGGSVLLKLPRRNADSDGTGDVDGDAEDSQGATPGVDDIEDSEPIAGGKPFRRIHGQIYVIENDEFITDDDPKGDEKIDANGNLLGGRQFKALTFVLPTRHPERRYMLAIEAARTSGFRDSLYYFRRNLMALKLNATQPEKDYLIDVGRLGGHLRTRNVTLITARSAYKLHGAKMLVDGRLVIDDYYEDKALKDITARGLKAGDPASELLEQDMLLQSEAAALNQANKAAANKQERSGLGIYRTGGPTTVFGSTGLGPFSEGPLNVAKKAMLNREGATEENWMKVMAERTSEANREWANGRREAIKTMGGIDSERGREKGRLRQKASAPAETPNGSGAATPAGIVNEGEANGKPSSKKAKERSKDQPDGIYEPHTGIVHFQTDTQPTRSRWVLLEDGEKRRRVLGGTKAGNGAWALAWVDTVMEEPEPDAMNEQERARQSLMRGFSIQAAS